jgi:hypothetical protein
MPSSNPRVILSNRLNGYWFKLSGGLQSLINGIGVGCRPQCEGMEDFMNEAGKRSVSGTWKISQKTWSFFNPEP